MSVLLVFNRVYRLEIQSVMLVFSTPLVTNTPLPSLQFTSPPYTVFNGGEVDRVVWRAYTGVIHCVFDQIPNLQNCFTTTNNNLGGEEASNRCIKQINNCRQVPLLLNFKEKPTFRI
jgi:hypothetical protein